MTGESDLEKKNGGLLEIRGKIEEKYNIKQKNVTWE
jgi:hypothetical protein